MPVDIQWLFDEQLPAQCARYPDRVRELGAIYQVHITGHDGGDWHLDLTADPPAVRPGIADADCTLTIASTDFQRLYQNPLMNGMTLYVQGNIKAWGDPSLYARFPRLLALPRAY